MRRFALQFAGFLAMQLAVAGGLLAVCCAVHPLPESYLAAARDKRLLLLTQREPRLVILGDSGAVYGLDSVLMARRVGRQPVNLGLTAGLEIGWNVRVAETGLRPGDVVLLHYFPAKWMQNQPNGDLLLRLLTVDPVTLDTWTASDVRDVLDRGAHLYWSPVARVGLSILFRPGSVPEDGYLNVARRVNLNAAGDMVGHAGLPTRWNPERTPFFRLDSRNAGRAIQALREFKERCRTRGIRVFLVTPPLPQSYWALSRGEIERLHSWVEAQTGIPNLNAPAANIWPDSEFFDGPAHPGRALARRHSEIVGDQLNRALSSDATR